MGQTIHLLIVIGSLAGIVFLLYRKIPLLLALGTEDHAKTAAQGKVLGQTLSKARSFASKTETKTAEWLERLRKRSEERKEEFSESYWQQLRKRTGRGREKN